RFIIEGRGLFHVRPLQGPVLAIEVEEGDLIRVPRGTWHWFNLCSDRRIRAIRLFQDPAGWTPHYTDSQADARYEPVCLGASYIPVSQTNGYPPVAVSDSARSQDATTPKITAAEGWRLVHGRPPAGGPGGFPEFHCGIGGVFLQEAI